MTADVLEKSHEQIQDQNRKTSKIKLTAMSEIVKLQEEYLRGKAMATSEESGGWEIKRWKVNTPVRENHLLCKEVRIDPAILVANGPWKILQDILRM